MLESYVSPLLMSYVNRYIKNLKPSDLQLSLWGGDVVLSKLDLRLDVLEQELKLPFTFLSGHIHELRIHVPWTKLSSEPVVITINTMECILKLRDGATDDNESFTSSSTNRSASESSKAVSKPRRVQQAPSDPDLPPGYVQSLIRRVVNNVNIVVNNLILKYVEDDIVLLVNITSAECYTVDDLWDRAFRIQTQEVVLCCHKQPLFRAAKKKYKHASIMSAVCQYFRLDQPASKTATCLICHTAISRGGTSISNFNTSNLIKHLKTRHPVEHDGYTKARAEKDEPCQTQQTLEASFKRREKFSQDSQRATKITDKIIKFIVLDDQPLSVVENVGFRRLIEHLEPRYSLPGRKYISETALPKLYETVREHISCKLKDVQSISFTTDIWSCDATPLSFLSLKAHWVDTVTPSSFTLQSAVLQANEFRGSHTGKSIAEAIEGMLVK